VKSGFSNEVGGFKPGTGFCLEKINEGERILYRWFFVYLMKH
jgi:hypothetical protein